MEADETDTVLLAVSADADLDSLGSREGLHELNFGEIKGLAKELLTVHGSDPGPNGDSVIQTLMENPNGFNTRIGGDNKLDKAKEIFHELEADIVAMPEHRINPQHKLNRNGMVQMFKGGEAEVRTQVGHNTHESVSKMQEGGTALLLYGPLID